MFVNSAKLFTTALYLAIGFGISAFAIEPTEKSELDLKPERVIVFKDGYCLIVKEGTAQSDDKGVVYTEEVPENAILGSFWAVSEESKIKSMVAGWKETTEETTDEVNCLTVEEVVTANVGKSCSLTINKENVSGTILKALTKGKPNVLALSSSAAHIPSAASSFILRTSKGDRMVSTAQVLDLTIKEMVTIRDQHFKKTTKKKRISIRTDKPNSKTKISLMYFRPDVRWIPTYRVNLTDVAYVSATEAKSNAQKQPLNFNKKMAEVMMQAEVINEAEDLADVPFHFVVGVPNFRFRSIPSPMTMEADVRSALAQVAPNLMGNNRAQSFSNALYTQRSGEFHSQRAVGNPATAPVQMPTELTGQGGNDLYVYELDKITLEKGERATIPILTAQVPYRDVYTWDVEITHSGQYAPTASAATSPLKLTENRVWRQIEMINDTNIPWTTGAAMFVDNLQPLAQELLTYTSPGGICRVPITVAVDLRGQVEDQETNRKLNALKWRGSNYANVDGKIDIELANNKRIDVPVEVNLRFGGRAKSASDDGKITLEPFRDEDWHRHRGDEAINNSSVVKWKANIKPGECFKPSVSYEYFIRY